MYHAIDMGVSVESFWDMSARAIVMLHREMRRSMAVKPTKPQDAAEVGPVRLDYIPRP